MGWLKQDLMFGFRSLLGYPGFTFISLLTLAICIGANTAVFSVINSVLLRPLPLPDPDRLVTLFNLYPGAMPDFDFDMIPGGFVDINAAPDYLDRRQATDTFQSLALVDVTSRNIGADGSPERLEAVRITPTFFDVIGRYPALGRTFHEEEAEQGAERVVILTHGIWRRVFGADSEVLGRSLRIDTVPHTVVGVLGQDFEIPGLAAELFIPLVFTEIEKTDQARHNNNYSMVGRLLPGVTLKQAQSRIDGINTANLERFPQLKDLLEQAGFHTVILGLQESLVRQVRTSLWMLQAAVAFVMLIGCVNIANLMLVRASGRSSEIALRFALGAGRGRVARQFLTEAVLLSVTGGVLGLVVGAGVIQLLSTLDLEQIPRGAEIQIDSTVLVTTLLSACATGLFFGAFPAFQVMGSSLENTLRQTDRSGGSGRSAHFTRSCLVIVQVALAFVLLVGACLLGFSLWNAVSVKPGFATERLWTARLSLPSERYREDSQIGSFSDRLLAEIRSLPSVERASLTSMLPFAGTLNSGAISIEGKPLNPGELPPVTFFGVVDDEFFETMGIPVLQGRAFELTDTAESAPVVVIDRMLAKTYWPDQSPIGARLTRGLPELEPDEEPSWRTIVGVVDTIVQVDLTVQMSMGTIYVPARQSGQRSMSLVIKSRGRTENLAASLRRAVLRMDPELPLYDFRSMEDLIDSSLAARRVPMLLLLAFAGLALLLASLGIYGVLAYSVTQRTQEIGVRMALGARPQSVLGLILWQGGRLTLLGLLIGGLCAIWTSQVMTTLLYEVRPRDPVVFLLVGLLLLLVSSLASLVPSWRATRINAVEALRWQ